MEEIRNLLKTNQIAIILEIPKEGVLDFHTLVGDDEADEEMEKQVDILRYMVAGMISEVSKNNVEWYQKGRNIYAAAEEMAENGDI